MPCLTVNCLYDYLDGALSAAEKRSVDLHLESCASCRAALAARKHLAETASILPDFEIPEDFASQVMAKVRAMPAPAPKKSRIWIVWPAAAVATIASGFGLYVLFSGQGALASLQKLGAAFGTYLQNAVGFAAKGLKFFVLVGKVIATVSRQVLATLQSVADMVGPEGQVVLAGGTLIILISGGLFLRRRFAESERTHEK